MLLESSVYTNVKKPKDAGHVAAVRYALETNYPFFGIASLGNYVDGFYYNGDYVLRDIQDAIATNNDDKFIAIAQYVGYDLVAPVTPTGPVVANKWGWWKMSELVTSSFVTPHEASTTLVLPTLADGTNMFIGIMLPVGNFYYITGTYNQTTYGSVRAAVIALFNASVFSTVYGYTIDAQDVSSIVVTAPFGGGQYFNTPGSAPWGFNFGYYIAGTGWVGNISNFTGGISGYQVVDSIGDKSGNGNTLTSIVTGTPPLSVVKPRLRYSALNGKPVLSSVGRLCNLQSTNNVPDFAGGGTIYCVASESQILSSISNFDSFGTILAAGNSTNFQLTRGNSSSANNSTVRAGFRSSTQLQSTLTTPNIFDDTFYTFHLRFNGTNHYLGVNGVEIMSAAVGTVTAIATPLTLFRGLASAFGNKEIAELLVYTVSHTPTQITQNCNYLRSEFNHY